MNLKPQNFYLSQAFHMLTTKCVRDVTDEAQTLAKIAVPWHKFIIDPAQFGDHLAPACYADDLLAHGLFQLPFDNLVIWMGPFRPEQIMGGSWVGHEAASVSDLVIVSKQSSALVGRIFRFALYPSKMAMNPGSGTLSYPLSMNRQEWASSDGFYELDEFERKELFVQDGRMMFGGDWPKPVDECIKDEKELFALTIFQLVGLLNAEGIISEEHRAPKFINKKRARSGEAQILSYHLLNLDMSKVKMPGVVAQGGTHASPRLHWRRGHVRKLSSGKITMVRPCLVGDVSSGGILKDYSVH